MKEIVPRPSHIKRWYDISNDSSVKWNKTYWGRMISWNNEFNQIEQTIKRLKEHKNSKTIAMQIYDPKSDGRKTMSGMPCLLSIEMVTELS